MRLVYRLPVMIAFAGLAICAAHAQTSDTPSFAGPFGVFDTNHDGTVSLAELNAGLKARFAALDTDHDGMLNGDEAAVENDRLLDASTAATPLFDWNGDGFIDFNEYSATWKSLFAQLDRNNDGVLTQSEANAAAPSSDGSAPAAQTGKRSRHRQ
jgi:Ca2+-binding EF-hand superfamily protein